MELREPIYYNVSELASFFHSFPHYDLKFTTVSPSFNPEYQPYQESLLLIAAVPVVWMLFWILIYMVYFCYFCLACRKRTIHKGTKTTRPERWFSFLFSIIAILVLVVAMFGNELINHSIKSAKKDFGDIKEDTDKMKIQSAIILHGIDQLKIQTAPFLISAYTTSGQLNSTDRPYLQNLARDLDDQLGNASKLVRDSMQVPLMEISIENKFPDLLTDYEMFRRLGTHGLSVFLILTTSFSLCSLGCKKKGFILMCVALAIFNVILVWAGMGFYSGVAVGTSDFCVNPTGYLLNPEGKISKIPSQADTSLRYYLECPPTENPFNKAVLTVQDTLTSAKGSLGQMVEKAAVLGGFVLQNITSAQSNITTIMEDVLQLSAFTECADSHRSYISAINTVCGNAILGETAIVGGFALAGIFIIILVFLLHKTARFTGTRRAYFEVDSQDNDYQSRDHQNRSDNPLYYRFSQISNQDDNSRVVSSSPQPSAPPRSSPPPAYATHKENFYSTYGNNGTLDSNTRVPTASNDLNRNSNTFRT